MRVEEDHAHHNFLDRYRWANTDLSSNSNIVVILHFDHSRPKLRNILFHLALEILVLEGNLLNLLMLILAVDNIFGFLSMEQKQHFWWGDMTMKQIRFHCYCFIAYSTRANLLQGPHSHKGAFMPLNEYRWSKLFGFLGDWSIVYWMVPKDLK